MKNKEGKKDLELNEENQEKENKEDKLDKVQKTLVSLAIILSLLGGTITITGIYDHSIDHTEKECPFAKILPKETAINHQKNAIIDTYASKDIIADVKYMEFDGNEPVKEIYAPSAVSTVPEGFELFTDEDGRQYWVAYEYTEPIKNEVDGKVYYTVPEGYTIGRDKDGNLVGMKQRFIKVDSNSFEDDENYKIINGIVYIKISEEESIAIDGYGYRSSYLEKKAYGTIEEKSEYLKLAR